MLFVNMLSSWHCPGSLCRLMSSQSRRVLRCWSCCMFSCWMSLPPKCASPSQAGSDRHQNHPKEGMKIRATLQLNEGYCCCCVFRCIAISQNMSLHQFHRNQAFSLLYLSSKKYAPSCQGGSPEPECHLIKELASGLYFICQHRKRKCSPIVTLCLY
jgi:hypothetical protein